MLYILMICVIFTSKLEIPEDGNDVLDDELDVEQFWYKVYTFSVADFNMPIRLVIQIIYISWNRNIKRIQYLTIPSFGFMSKLST